MTDCLGATRRVLGYKVREERGDFPFRRRQVIHKVINKLTEHNLLDKTDRPVVVGEEFVLGKPVVHFLQNQVPLEI